MKTIKEAIGKAEVKAYVRDPIQVKFVATKKVCIFQRLDEGR